MIVIDASALVELLMLTAPGLRIAERAFGKNNEIHAPEVIDLKVPQVARRAVRQGDI